MSTPDLDAIQARITDCRTYNFGMRNADKLAHEDAPALLALARSQQAKIERVRELAENAPKMQNMGGWSPGIVLASDLRAALTATEGAV